MKRPSSLLTGLIAVAMATAGLLLPTGAVAHAAPSILASCSVNITAGTHNCSGVPGISVQSLSGVELLMKLTFTAGQTATFTVTYNSTPGANDFTVNLGDSVSNNGGGGDSGHQSNDAEMMIFGDDMTIWGHDGLANKLLASVNNISLGSGSVVSFEVSNDELCWNTGSFSCLSSQWLYALNGQSDSEGSVNFDIYAGFNRVVSGSPADRDGTSVSFVSVSLS
jgi:hypothetical protein